MPNNTISPELIGKFHNINILIKEKKIDEAKAAVLNLSASEKPAYVQWTKDQVAKATEIKRRQEELAARERELLARQQELLAERESIMRGYAKKFSKG